jgi:hypothetical protein
MSTQMNSKILLKGWGSLFERAGRQRRSDDYASKGNLQQMDVFDLRKQSCIEEILKIMVLDYETIGSPANRVLSAGERRTSFKPM